jgi:hypothetical protein
VLSETDVDYDRLLGILPWASGQRVVDAFVKTAYADAVESLFIDFQIGAGQRLRGQLLDCKADGLGGTVKSPIPKRLTAGLSIPGGKQLGLTAVVERTHRLILGCGKGVDRPIIDLSPLDTRPVRHHNSP